MAIREKVWKCSDCGTDSIKGRLKECPNCGSSREKGEMRSLKGVGSPAVTDPELIALARAGADWFCSHCTSGNRGDGDRCSECGAPRYATAEEDHPDFQGAHKNVEGAEAKLEREMAQDPRAGTLSDDPPPPPRPPPPRRPVTYDEPMAPPPPDNRGFIAVVILGLVAAILLVWGLIWAFTTHDVQGAVSSLTWTRTAHVERWTDTTVRKWQHETREISETPPTNGAGERAGIDLVEGSCRDEHFEDERYVCGSHQECEDIYRTEEESYSCTRSEEYECGETCTDLGNGFEDCNPKYCTRSVSDTCKRDKRVFDHQECKSVNDYCTRPIFKSKCDYATQTWKSVGDYPTSGTGIGFQWASTNMGALDRVLYSATYTVKATYTEKGEPTQTHTLVESKVSRGSKSSAESAAIEYLSWKVGDPVFFKINNLGGVSSASRHETP